MGFQDGNLVGIRLDGASDRGADGLIDGDLEGDIDGRQVGKTVGDTDREREGITEGSVLGLELGAFVGYVGIFEGENEGIFDDDWVVGDMEGRSGLKLYVKADPLSTP